ncbi:MAG TPA: suppressor of fused domain protein [Thermoanaerobaculia bacterium]|nr:suppressor of fused domain protein [Thermoanaerobaculia bacterium]
MATDHDWFEETWRYRDTVLYPEQLGTGSTGTIITIPYIAFAQMGVEQVDPRWLHCGVLMFPPTAARRNFSFVTSGLSTAWDDDEPDAASVSGLGIELRIDTFSEEHWPKDVLLRLSAMQLLVGAGRLAGARLLGHGDRVRVGAETFGGQSTMTSLLATEVADLQLPSGAFKLIQLFAITDAERELATTQGTEALLTPLRETTTYPVNDITRHSIL